MANILDKIIADKRIEVQQKSAQRPLASLTEAVADLPKCRNFYKAVTKPNARGVNVIAEVKKASPSAGVIREDFDPVEIATIYHRCGADAVSVLTDEKYFQGKLEYIADIKKTVPLPVLRKDFIIDKYQVYEARAAGADAILLIADVLKPAEVMDLLILASKLTMTSIIEVHSADTLLALRSLVGFPLKHYSVIGINNRDLTTMEVDLNTTSRLSELVDNKRELVAESGIKTRADVEKIISLGLGAILIGQTLCASPDIENKFKELFNPEAKK
ncbi:MAG: indole-3-glycerol phosphate synthase TrpC [Planctomycetota bacterium]